MPAKLTRRFLLGLEEGAFVVSRILDANLTPCLAEAIAPPGEPRARQWERIKRLGVDQRTCEVLPSRSAYDRRPVPDAARSASSPAPVSVEPETVALTRRALDEMTAGSFLISNTLTRVEGVLWPRYARAVQGAGLARRAQWEEIKAAGVDQRRCHVFPSEEAARTWIVELPR